MTRDQILARLRELKPELAANNSVRKIAIFGSVARGEARPDSDVDVLVEFERTPGFFKFIELQDLFAAKLGAPVDLFTRNSLHPKLRDRILREAIYV